MLASSAALITAIFIVFAQSWTFDFLSWDDTMYVVGNPKVLSSLSLDGLRWEDRRNPTLLNLARSHEKMGATQEARADTTSNC